MSLLKYRKIKGDKQKAVKADKELILNAKNDKTQIKIVIKKTKKSNAAKTPNPVATPLPPLKFNQTG